MLNIGEEEERSLVTNSLGRTAASFCDFARVKPGFRPWNYTQTDNKSFVDYLIQKYLEPSDCEPQKWAENSPNCPKCIFSLNIVNGSLGRESALFVWWAERREKSSTLMEKAAANPPAASHMKREDDSYAKPFNELRMCCIKKLKRKITSNKLCVITNSKSIRDIDIVSASQMIFQHMARRCLSLT